MSKDTNRLRLDALKELVFQRFDSLEKAVRMAADENRLKQAAQNEWRAQYADLSNTFARRDYVDSKIWPLEESKNMLAGKASAYTANGALLLSVLALLASTINIVLDLKP